jgi:hypothetical protein
MAWGGKCQTKRKELELTGGDKMGAANDEGTLYVKQPG